MGEEKRNNCQKDNRKTEMKQQMEKEWQGAR